MLKPSSGVTEGRNSSVNRSGCLFVNLVRVLTVCISLSKPLLADHVRKIEYMKFVGDVGLGYQ